MKINHIVQESYQTCPECGGPAFSDLLLAEKKDACYNKVRSRYKVWPSAYASGALVQCRKKGAANWGNKSKNESVTEDQTLAEEFDIIENTINYIAEFNNVDAEVIWEDLESLSDDELYVFAVTTPIMEDWQKVNKKDRTDGMSRKAVKAYRREHPGSKLKTAVTTKPSKLKRGSKASKRRSSYCSRSRGQMKMHSISCAKTPDKAICKARRRWNCESIDFNLTEGTDPQTEALIRKYYEQIAAQGDDSLDYLNDRAPLFAQFWDQYEGDLDSIIVELSPKNLVRIAAELKRVAGELQGVAENHEQDPVAAFLARGGQIQRGKLHKPRKAEKWQGSAHIGAAGGKGSKGTVSGLGANTNPKGGKPVVTAEDQGLAEGAAGDPYAFGDDDYMDLIQGMIDDNRRNMSPSRKPRVLAATKRYIEQNGGVFDPDVFEYAYDQIVEFSRGMDESLGVAEGNKKPEPPEADYGDEYQAMVARVKKLAGLGPLKTVYDPKKRVYRNMPTAQQPPKK